MTFNQAKVTAQTNQWLQREAEAAAILKQAILTDPIVKAYVEWRAMASIAGSRIQAAQETGGVDVDRNQLRSTPSIPATPLLHPDLRAVLRADGTIAATTEILASDRYDSYGTRIANNARTSEVMCDGPLAHEHSGIGTPSLLSVLVGVIDEAVTARAAADTSITAWQNAQAG